MMTTRKEQLTQLTPLQRATLAVKKLREKVDALERVRREPIAIIGIACRFPGGASSPQAFWDLLRRGVDACSEVPRQRWDLDYDPTPGVSGKTSTRRGGFLDEVDRFDAEFFRMTPREAADVDPQQRLLLEVAWEALEHAGLPPDKLVGSQTGVFLGMSPNDDAASLSHARSAVDHDVPSGTGNSAGVASGRLASSFGFQGPCMSIDTACSSSLVAAHLAVQSLRHGECSLALLAGVNLMLAPPPINSADGYVRGEGCGVLVLKRLAAARVDGDRILAVMRGSAVNQDGRRSDRTAPNGQAREAVMRQALDNAGLSPLQVSHIEAHGTGTTLGDATEARALSAVYGPGRAPDQPLYLGSVKTNIGHLEAGAGVASLIKMTLALMHGEIPPLVHVNQLNPQIALDYLPAVLPTSTQPWGPIDGQRLAGISAFGYNGTNAHVLMAEAPPPEVPPSASERPAHLLCLSAKSDPALQELAGRYAASLATSADALADVCASANTGRSHFTHRLAVVVGHAAEARARLADYHTAGEAAEVISGRCGHRGPQIAMMFSGQGAQYAGMGRGLYDTLPRFREVLEHCDALLRGHLDRPLLSILFADRAAMDQTKYTQPALFAFAVALAEAWRSLGIEPCAVLGHGVGEYAAACVAGVFDLEAGLRLVAARGRLMQALPGGAMAAVRTDPATVQWAIDAAGHDLVAIAAHNGPHHTVLSGDGWAVRRVMEKLEAEGITCRPLPTSHALHSPLLEPILDAFECRAAELSYQPARVDIFANLTGAAQRLFDAGYWRQQTRQPVQFADGLRHLVAQGCDVVLEIGPDPVLIGMGRQCVAGHVWVPSQRRSAEGWRTFLEGVGRLYVHGAEVDWANLEGGPRRTVALPTYPFARQRHRVDTQPVAADNAAPTSHVAVDLPTDLSDKPGLAVSRPALRHDPTRPVIVLAPLAPDQGVHTARHSQRHFVSGTIASTRLSALLACLRATESVSSLTPKYRYPSAGALYPVEVYMHIQPLRIEGLPGGSFAYQPLAHTLMLLTPEATMAPDVHLPPNQALFVQAAFSLFLVGRLAAVESIHGALARDFCLLEAGHMGQLLMEEAPRHGLGLCPIGSLHFDRIRAAFDLAAGDVLLYSFVGGAEAEGAVTVLSPLPLLGGGEELLPQPVASALGNQDGVEQLWDAAVGAGRGHTRTVSVSFQPEDATVFAADLDNLYCDAVSNALLHFGVFNRAGQRYTVDELLEQCAIKPHYRRWLSRALTALADCGRLQRQGAVFVCTTPLLKTIPNLERIWGFDTFGLTPADFHGLRRVVDDLPQLLTDTMPSAAIYAAREISGLCEALCQHTNPVVRQVVGAVAERREPLRILEVGAGLGSTTGAVLPGLSAQRTTYWCTDSNPYFLQAVRQAFAEYPFVEYSPLDIARHPEEQGYALQSFDVVLATSTLHATRDVAESLRHLRALLAPGGLLVLAEATRFYAWFDLSIGLRQEFDRFTDVERRQTHPLLTPEQWHEVLLTAGFARCELLRAPGSIADALGFHVLLAQAPHASMAVTS